MRSYRTFTSLNWVVRKSLYTGSVGESQTVKATSTSVQLNTRYVSPRITQSSFVPARGEMGGMRPVRPKN